MNLDDIIEHYEENGTDSSFTVDEVSIATRTFKPDKEPQATLICVSGGPGVPGAFLAPIARLSEHGYRVICYDQHNIGNSEEHPEPYRIKTFKQEIEELVNEYDKPVLVGHSWGAMLSLDYARDSEFSNPDALACIAPLFDSRMNTTIARTRRAETLDSETVRRLTQLEANSEYGDEYESLEETVYDVHVYNAEKPEFVEDQYERFNEDMYEEMWGYAEYELREGATLEGWSVLDDYATITEQTLLVTGEDDLFGTHDLLEAEQEMPNASAEIIPEASHAPLWETPQEFHQRLRSWLQYTEF